MDTENDSLGKDVSFNDGKGYEHAGVHSSFLGGVLIFSSFESQISLMTFYDGSRGGKIWK